MWLYPGLFLVAIEKHERSEGQKDRHSHVLTNLIFHFGVTSSFKEYFSQFSTAHGRGYMQGSVSILFLFIIRMKESKIKSYLHDLLKLILAAMICFAFVPFLACFYSLIQADTASSSLTSAATSSLWLVILQKRVIENPSHSRAIKLLEIKIRPERNADSRNQVHSFLFALPCFTTIIITLML